MGLAAMVWRWDAALDGIKNLANGLLVEQGRTNVKRQFLDVGACDRLAIAVHGALGWKQ